MKEIIESKKQDEKPRLEGYAQICLGKPDSSLLGNETHILAPSLSVPFQSILSLSLAEGFALHLLVLVREHDASASHLRSSSHHLICIYPWPPTPCSLCCQAKAGPRTGSPSTLVTLAYRLLEHFFS